MSSRVLLGVVLLSVVSVRASGRTEWQMQGALVYADNLFQYSTSDLEAFRHRSEPARFPIRTTDDLAAALEFSLGRRFRVLGRGTLVSLRTRLHGYFSNPAKSYGALTVYASQGLTPTSRTSLSYLYMPNYLIRSFPDPTRAGEYTACTFSEHLVTVRLRQRLGTITLEPRYRFEVDVYARPFQHYDTRAHRPGAELGWELLRGLNVTVDYEYKLASAKGPVPDISYRQHCGELRVLTRPRRLSRVSFEAGLSLAQRTFTTANSGAVDPGHAGRVDWLEGISTELRYQLAGAAVVVGYELEWRDVTSPWSERIEDIKEYRAGRLSIGVDVTARGRS